MNTDLATELKCEAVTIACTSTEPLGRSEHYLTINPFETRRRSKAATPLLFILHKKQVEGLCCTIERRHHHTAERW